MATSAVSTSHFLPSLRTNPPSSSSSSSSYCFTNSRCLKNNPLVSHGRRGRMMEARMSMGMEHIVGGMDVDAALERAQGFLYTIADAAVVATDQASSAPVKNNGWFGFLADGMEEFLKVLKNGLTTVHVPYAYGFAIITLTVLVKVATFPLTKKQVESTIAMQNLQPKISAIQKRYGSDKERVQLETARLYKQAGVNPLAGCLPTLATMPVWIGLYQALSNVANEGLLTEGFFWIPSLAGPTTIAARQSGSGISWLFPFVDGHPPLGWPETISYLILPMLLIGSQYVSMQVLQPPQSNDPSQKNAQVVLKFLPFLLGYFSLSVPSGLTLYWLTNNVLSTGQQVWLRKLGGAKPVVNKDGNGIISAGQARRSALTAIPDIKEADRGERFRQRKAEEEKRKIGSGKQDVDVNGQNVYQSTESSIGQMDIEGESISEEKDSLDEIYVASGNGTPVSNSALKRSKRAKRSRTAKRS